MFNDYGVFGEDITLAVDPIVLSKTNPDASPNAFTRNISNGGHANISKFFQVCYPTKTPPALTLMRSNYWGTQNSRALPPVSTLVTDPLPFIILRPLAACASDIPMPVDVSEPFTRMPTVCTNEIQALTVASNADCTDPVSGSNPNSILQQFMIGLAGLKSDDIDGAQDAFAPVAALFSTAPSTQSAACQMLINTARCFTDGQNRPSNNRSGMAAQSGGLLLSPNPANQSVQVRFAVTTESSTTLRVLLFDALGSLVRSVEATDAGSSGITIDVSDLTPGLYFVQATDGSRLVGGKLVVER